MRKLLEFHRSKFKCVAIVTEYRRGKEGFGLHLEYQELSISNHWDLSFVQTLVIGLFATAGILDVAANILNNTWTALVS